MTQQLEQQQSKRSQAAVKAAATRRANLLTKLSQECNDIIAGKILPTVTRYSEQREFGQSGITNRASIGATTGLLDWNAQSDLDTRKLELWSGWSGAAWEFKKMPEDVQSKVRNVVFSYLRMFMSHSAVHKWAIVNIGEPMSSDAKPADVKPTAKPAVIPASVDPERQRRIKAFEAGRKQRVDDETFFAELEKAGQI
jgi:hypothetical protein